MIFVTQMRKLISISLVAALLLLSVPQSYALQVSSGSVVIYQVQVGAPSSASQEFISIYNNSSEPEDVTGWCVTYSSASDATQSQLGCIKPPNTSTKLLLSPYRTVTLATQDMVSVNANYTPDIAFTAGLAGTSGHIKLLETSKNVVDTIGWGAAVHPEGTAVAAPASGKILQRSIQEGQTLKDTDNNSADFYQTNLVIPTGNNIVEVAAPLPEYAPSIVLSEVMPDAAGADAGKEFIEFYNSGAEAVSLKEFSLQLGPTFAKSYPLPDMLVESDSYVSLSDVQSGVVLPNTSATLRLVTSTEVQADETSYADLGEDVAWAHFEDSWHKTYQLTPGTENIILPEKPCPAGETRSSDTGQCKSTVLAAATTACKEGQVRNLETGRCRNIAVAATATACKPGQEKNPLTGRCKNIATTAAAKECPAGQERNVATGRCKKIIASPGAGGTLTDVPTALVTNNIKWWIAGAALAGTAGYGAFEWRRELFGFLAQIKNRFIPQTT